MSTLVNGVTSNALAAEATYTAALKTRDSAAEEVALARNAVGAEAEVVRDGEPVESRKRYAAAGTALATAERALGKAGHFRDETRALAAVAIEHRKALDKRDAAHIAALAANERATTALVAAIDAARSALATARAAANAARDADSQVPIATQHALQMSPAMYAWDMVSPSATVEQIASHLSKLLAVKTFAAAASAPAPTEHDFTPNAGRKMPDWLTPRIHT